MKKLIRHKVAYRIITGFLIVIGFFFVHRAIARQGSSQLVALSNKAISTPNKAMTSITIVAATNRSNSLTAQVAKYYAELLKKKGCEIQFLTLTDLPADFTANALYENFGKNAAFNRLKKVMETSQKYVFIIPEYNGSFPGVFKAFIDGLKFPATFTGKKCAMVGVSKGPRGGVFAMSHLTDVFHIAGMSVYPSKPRLAHIYDSQLATVLADPVYVKLLEKQAEGIINY